MASTTTPPATTSPYDNWCERHIPEDQYAGGYPIDVELRYHADMSAVGSVIVEDIYPPGWAVSGISDGGEDTGSSVRWSPPVSGGGPLSYTLTPPASAREAVQFGGSMSASGTTGAHQGQGGAAWVEEVPITGDTELGSAVWKLYWSDVATRKVQRSNLDGSGVEDLVELSESDSYSPEPLLIGAADLPNVQAFLNECYLPPNMRLPAAMGSVETDPAGASVHVRAIRSMSGFLGLRDVHSLSESVLSLLTAVTEAAVPDPLAAILLAAEALAVLESQIDAIANYIGAPTGGEVPQPDISAIMADLAAAVGGSGEGDQGQPRPMSDFQEPQGIAVDVPLRKMYWVGLEAAAPDIEKIQRANLDGTGVEDVLVSGRLGARDLAIAGGAVYWFARHHNEIRRCGLDGSDPETVVNTSQLTAAGAFDPTRAHVSLAADGSNLYVAFGTKIVRIDLALPGDLETVADGLSLVRGIALDADAGKLYWADGGADRVQRSDLDGSGRETLAEGSLNPQRVAIDPVTCTLYWTDSGPRYGPSLGMSGRILAAPADGSAPPRTVVEGLDLPQGIAVGPDLPAAEPAATTAPPATTTAPATTAPPATTTAPPATTTAPPATAPPAVSEPIFDVDTEVRGTSAEEDGTLVRVYVSGQPLPGTATVASGEWTMPVESLDACDTVVARAKAPGRPWSVDSNEAPVLPLAMWGDPCGCAPAPSPCDADGRRTHQLTLRAEGEGRVLPAPGTTTRGDGERVRVSAVPAPGWELLRWRAEEPAHSAWESTPAIANSTDPSAVHTVLEDAVLVAEFTPCPPVA